MATAAEIHTTCRLIDTGDDAPGVLLNRCSAEFREASDRADLIIAKGQGNYESLSSFTEVPIVFPLMVKCDAIARYIRHPVGSFVLTSNSAGIPPGDSDGP